MATQPTDPYRGFRFRVEISGLQVAAFSEASVPDITIDTVDYREGTDPAYKRSLSGLTSHGHLSLKKGLTDSMDLYNWHQTVSQKGSTFLGAKKNLSLILIDTDGTDKVRWNLINAWPTKYSCTSLNAATSDVVVETLELAMDYISRVK